MQKLIKYLTIPVATVAILAGAYSHRSNLEEKVQKHESELVEPSQLSPRPKPLTDISEEKEAYDQIKKVENPGYLSDFSEKDLNETTKIIYAEGADQPLKEKILIGRTILNRAISPDYPDTPYKVIHQRNAFSCTFDGSHLWEQANSQTFPNEISKNAFYESETASEFVYEGKNTGVPREEEITAYHDDSISKPETPYWETLKLVHEGENLKFYAPRQE